MPTRFIPEKELIDSTLSERDFSPSDTLTDDQNRVLADRHLLDGFDRTKEISVKVEPALHGITISQK
ncbi:hypothetical protein NSND_60295 [Nitrospira sp. ND1]|jgi:hypothetical protein|nr:hypothetical protein NSND_60295 [Nitrospira sp. ND1]